MEGVIKINIDGSFSEQGKSAGVGLVCRDSQLFWCGLAKKVLASSAFMAEYLALKEALLMRKKFASCQCLL